MSPFLMLDNNSKSHYNTFVGVDKRVKISFKEMIRRIITTERSDSIEKSLNSFVNITPL